MNIGASGAVGGTSDTEMLAGWKDIASRISAVVGYDVSVDAVRKMVDRDAEFARIVGESVTGKPLVSKYELDKWVTLKTLTKKRRLREAIREMVKAGQTRL